MEHSVPGRQRRKDVDGNGNVVIALARGLELLRAFGPGDDYLGNAELARRTGIPRPTVSRLTATLTTLGYLRYSERMEKYQLGPGVLALGFRYLVSLNIRDIARPFMQELADSTDCMVALGTEDREFITYIETCQGNGPLVVRMEVGSRIPVASSAIGRAYVAGLSEPQRARYLAQLRTHYSAERWQEIERLLELGCEQYRRYGFCMSLGEWEPDVHGVGVPLVLKGQDEILALNCGGVAHRLTREVIETRLGPRLVEVAARIAEQAGGLGYSG